MLRKIDHACRTARFYRVDVVPTLFGERALRREWGRIGGAARGPSQTAASRAEAERRAAAWLAAKRRRGYAAVPESSGGP